MHNKLNHTHLLQKIIHLQKGDTKRRKNTTDDRWVALYNYILEQMNNYGKPREDIVITTTLYRQQSQTAPTMQHEKSSLNSAKKVRYIEFLQAKHYYIRWRYNI